MNNDYNNAFDLSGFHQYVETESCVSEKFNSKKQESSPKSLFAQRNETINLDSQKSKKSDYVREPSTPITTDEELPKPAYREIHDIGKTSPELPAFESSKVTEKSFEFSDFQNNYFGLSAPVTKECCETPPVVIAQSIPHGRNSQNKGRKQIKSSDKETFVTSHGDDSQKSVIKNNKFKEIFTFILPTLLALLIAVGLRGFVFTNTTVPTGSMLDTIQIGSRLIGSKLSYDFGKSPERFDIVIFKYPDNEKQDYVKRVIGLPGETVEIVDGKVYINGSASPLKDAFVTTGTPTGNYGPYRVPANSYFMLGDNRENSNDSRFWKNQFVHKDKISAKVIFQYYPSIKSIK